MRAGFGQSSILTTFAADRILAATAAEEKLEFWHTDTVLKRLTGFPQKYFTNISKKPSA